jgi:sarcosine oxidase, subunit alpha
MTDSVLPPETMSAAAQALGAGRLALSRSFRLHRPRGAFCHAGWCQQCRVTLPDGRIALACQSTETPAPPRGGWRRLMGRIAERLPPWFYEQHLLAPRALRQFYLERLRRLSAAAPLPASLPPISGHWRDRRCEILVVGGGIAGMTAAISIHEAGRDVLLVESEESLGGRARFQPVGSPSLSSVIPAKAGIQGPPIALLAKLQAQSAALPHLLNTTCLGLYEQAREALLIGPDGPITIAFEELVVATGAYDRLPSFAGNDLPGIIGLRAFERLTAAAAIPTAWRIGVFADAESAAAALATGQRLAWIAGPGDLPATGVQHFPATTLLAAEGRDRVTGARLDNAELQPCDLLVLGFSQPSYQLQMQAGQRAMLAGAPPVVLTEGEALIPLTVVGEAAWKPAPTAQPATRASPDAFLCPCEDVRRRDGDAAIADGFADIELLKRRTGAGTGPCQGKLCHGEMLACLAEAGRPVALPTVRPLLCPTSLAALAAADSTS